jgi:Ca2+-binding RTX toxin-like protein
MATLSARTAFDMDDWDFSAIVDGDLTAHDDDHFEIEDDSGEVYNFDGHDFEYLILLGIAMPVAGTVNSLAISGAGGDVVDVSGITIDVGTLYVMAGAGQFDALVALLFEGNDAIKGSKFDDILRGEAGKDAVSGGKGDDRLNGGADADKLTGGAGGDSFFYAGAFESTGLQHDTVADFKAADDAFIFDLAIAAVDAAIAGGRLSRNNFDADLADAADDAHLGPHHAVLFTPDAGRYADVTFLVVDLNGDAGYQVGGDAVIRFGDAANLAGLGTGNFLSD